MNEKLIFAYDLDGTLMFNGNEMNSETINALEKVNNQGYINVVATGRALARALPILDLVKGIDYFICSNGTIIYDVKKKKTIILGQVDKDIFYDVFPYALKHNLIMRMDSITGSIDWMKNKQSPDWMKDEEVMDMSSINLLDDEEFKNEALDPNKTWIQVALRSSKNEAQCHTNFFANLYNNKYSVTLTNGRYTDINPFGYTKWTGIQSLLSILKLEDYKIISFGDSGNDVEMLQKANFGFAMANASAEAKEAADEVIGYNTSNTIANKILSLIKR
ncbi:Cof-type HAD-IIB family hydrolase [Mycoplasma sp. Mirounga ES2805-ORL]|uniref:Cof-type HAD-IIB family hydrolase n=1 Tax=Mycoplasma sp. Mirounga ES2805-ORL TaxID=754514 RepID=UPI00197C18DC|nr:Cof-type HAD-IIB family hydrolase [Mycoplasma sp. Mirounga ES2805-ORL]QSF13857.1 Cof-type HAD-IIB family hydrolase [Mycoplasma sp. Mirounga ES2805-ORL]